MRGRAGNVAIRLRIIARALRFRGASAVMLFLVAAVAIAGAAVGPMFVQAADDSVVATAIESAPAGSADVSMIVSGGPQASSELSAAVAEAKRAVRSNPFVAPIFGADLGARFQLHGKVTSGFTADLISRTAICDHVRISRGHCPAQEGQVLLSERSAAVSGLQLGSRLALYAPQGEKALRVTIVGLYVQPPTVNDAYWGGNNVFSYGTATGPIIALDALIVSPSTIRALATSATPAQFQALLAWRLSALVVGSRALDHELSAIDSTVATSTSVSVSTALTSIIASAQHDENVMGSVVLAIVLQIVLLSLLVIYALGRSAAMQRRVETEFARRRGFPRSALLSLAVGEPAALIAAAFP
ncbi:MAG TPA: hypothetical protein VKR27_07305, partial [Acidimicrobiales bacterium]|nr:hypothetical protein [Acidimicrobiales bacterium]